MAAHVLAVPSVILVLRILQIVLAVIILGLSAYGIYWIAFDVRTNVTHCTTFHAIYLDGINRVF